MILLLALLVGLVIGSFLNVVILRWPEVMEWEWRAGARECLGLPEDSTDIRPSSFNQGRSACPQCHTELRAIDNIPLFSFLFLRGRCAHCGKKISWQYPLVEAGTALLFGLVTLHFGVSFGALLLLVTLVSWWVLLWIDARTYLLPDPLVYLGLWAGLLGAALALPGFISAPEAIAGALVGWGLLWSVCGLFRLVTGKEGMGAGDFKLLAAIGAWVGPFGIMPVVIISTLLGGVFGVTLIFRGRDKAKPIPFGPFLILGSVVAFFFPQLWQPWLHF